LGFYAYLGRLALRSFGEREVWWTVYILQNIELMLELGGDEDVVLGNDGVVVVA
jgi:hypothetical protein